MAGDWIKMRGSLLQSPKVIALAKILHDSESFREWVAPGGSGFFNGQVISNEALRCVTCALLLRVWSCAREHGKFEGMDLIFPTIKLADLDDIAGVHGFGKAMAAIGWASQSDHGVTLPNFKEYNVPASPAERQKKYRTRAEQTVDNGTSDARYGALRRVAPREEKSREDNTPLPPKPTNGKQVASVKASELAFEWCHQCRRSKDGYPADRPDDMAIQFDELLRTGLSFELLMAEVKRPERVKLEHFWEFVKRLKEIRAGPFPVDSSHATLERLNAQRARAHTA